MVDFFDRLYYNFNQENKTILKKVRFYSIMRFLIRIISNFTIPLYFKFKRYNPVDVLSTKTINNQKIIVSLTSFPARIDKLWIVIECIFRQSFKPNKIILWLSKEQFHSIDELPKKLLKQREKGLEIILVDGDIRSHKKYYYAMAEFPNDLLITMDDDLYYRRNFIESLVNHYLVNPENVIAHYCKKIIKKNEVLQPYLDWLSINSYVANSHDLFFGTGGGVLFPIRLLPNIIFDKQLFLKLTPSADDIWLNSIIKFKNISITNSGEKYGYLPLQYNIEISLHMINNINNQNDVQINSINQYFKEQYNINIF